MTVNETHLINIPLMGHTVHSSSLRPHKSLLLCCEPEELKDILGEHALGKHHHATTSTDSMEHVMEQPRAQPGLKERAVAMEAIDGPILGGGGSRYKKRPGCRHVSSRRCCTSLVYATWIQSAASVRDDGAVLAH